MWLLGTAYGGVGVLVYASGAFNFGYQAIYHYEEKIILGPKKMCKKAQIRFKGSKIRRNA